ncbi:hypothetical protein EHI8A_066080 [Entamoeba histolytica HM-1:IMSS-B]|uniref:Uncharacterized protein n=6 Tax=Entamoeba histolytica TaxID=5759 RepID=B1N399_ENTH1|nr:hypothetical protein EHI_015420 [Entamoeba histolytica HM-1:IMSS]EMD48716.1 Hypothetical protein EHI5A_095750 [Entamoeba histolytica KU27]EMH72849.1 hypothetical protein EHI8A_066080 [Entamoeba histolytica HM-1:IMSS-B]ENY62874.1 hypothetical protein EHI7A_070430 [Entamoeba histolytica HM-1:IMSS-A]GAT94834.1 hypothetical protein CL6EHI_015420 [Entamoeba histolytica]EDS89560.1 hypothetical protein EHI_015420 [Entamoeba histolytica HM-1:IMSS]|eukprot:XP_001913665.1 hypothetical protein EHI_015420 [Entamoeba histolytica HM-1:IMSS]
MISIALILCFFFTLSNGNIGVAQFVFSLPIDVCFGIASNNDGYMIVTGNAKSSIISVNQTSFETVRTDGPFRSLTGGYTTVYSSYLKQFIVYGRERSRFGRFSLTLVGDLIDYEPSFSGSSTVFVDNQMLTLGFVPKIGGGFIKICQIDHIPRLDAPIVDNAYIKDNVQFDEAGHDNNELTHLGKGAATICVKNPTTNECTYVLFAIGDHINPKEGYNTTFMKIFTLDKNLENKSPYYDDAWGTKYPSYSNNKGIFNLGDMTSSEYIKFWYNEDIKWLFVMSQNTDIGNKESKSDTPCVLVIKPSYDTNTNKVHIDFDFINTPTFNYIHIDDTHSFGQVIDTSYDSDKKILYLVISAPEAIVEHSNIAYSMGLIYHYTYDEEQGFQFKMYFVPPVLENNYGFGRAVAIYKEEKIRRVFIVNAVDNHVYESTIPVCGDGIVTTEVGEECEEGDGCKTEKCLCIDNYVATNGKCELKCERNTCNCDLTNPCISCNVEHLNISTRCQECDSGYELLNGICKTVCGNKIRSSDEQCDQVDNCDENCTCYVGYIPSDNLENRCIISKKSGLIAWMAVQAGIAIIVIVGVLAFILIKLYIKARSRLNITGSGGVVIYESGSTAKLQQFEENEAERYPLYYINNSPFMYSFSNEINFYLEEDLEHIVDKLELKKKYVFQLFVGNKSLNICSFAIGDPRLDKDDYDLEFTPDKGNIRAGDIICIYGKLTPLRECAVKENFTLTVVNLNTTKSYIQNIPLAFSVED